MQSAVPPILSSFPPRGLPSPSRTLAPSGCPRTGAPFPPGQRLRLRQSLMQPALRFLCRLLLCRERRLFLQLLKPFQAACAPLQGCCRSLSAQSGSQKALLPEQARLLFAVCRAARASRRPPSRPCRLALLLYSLQEAPQCPCALPCAPRAFALPIS